MPHKGNGNGFGWQWRYVAFTLTEETTINVAVSASATSGQQWVSFGDYTIQTDNEANLAMIGYNIALNDAKLAKANDAYKNVTGAELTALNTSPANNPKVGNWFVEKWGTAGSVDFNQTISDLPAGYYKVTVRARNEADAVAYLYANDEKVAFVKNTTDTYSTNVVIANTGALKIGVSCENHPGNTWLAVDHFTLTYLGPVANMTITDAQWGTFYAPFDVTLPESAFAYTITVDDNKTVRNKVAEGGETVPANTAVLVYSASAINENFVGAPVAEAPVGLENALIGTLEPIASGAAPAGAYYLAKNADSILRNIQGLPVNKGYNGIVIMNGKKYLKK